MDRLRRGLQVLVFLLLLLIIPACIFLLAPTWVRYRVTERYAFAGGSTTGVYLAVMLPRSGPYQRVENVVVEWPGTVARESRKSLDVFTLMGMVEGSEVVITYEVALPNARVNWDAPAEEKDLSPEDEIESAAPLLVNRAAGLRGEEDAETAYRIYAFTARHLSWPEGSRVEGEQSALAAYQTGVGACGEFANLMTALCRAADIPARPIGGLSFPTLMPPYLTKQRTWMHPAGSHAWVEVEVGDRWALADPSLASNLPLDRFWLGRNLGRYLSYGARAEHDCIYEDMIRWAEGYGGIVGAMSAPIRFVASAQGENVSVEPVVSVQKREDPRWWGAAGGYIAIPASFVLVERVRLSLRNRDA